MFRTADSQAKRNDKTNAIAKGKRVLFCFGILFVCGLVLIGALDSFVKRTTAEQILSPEDAIDKQADCILVLGCMVRPDGTLSLMLRDRLEKGIALYQAGASTRLLMSGDHGTKSYDEVNAMKTYALEQGIPEEVIFMDHAGFDTYDSIYRAKEIFCAETVIVVSQEYHLPRALYIANQLGIEAYGVAAENIAYRGQRYRELREVLARAKDFVQAGLHLKPKFLGEQIPLNGSGTASNG